MDFPQLNALPPGGSVFVDDISRLFIYYVGRKRDQQLDRSKASASRSKKPWENHRKTIGKPLENGGLMGFNGI